MSNGITDWGAAQWLAALFGVVSPISGYYVALATDQPGVDADGTILADLEPTDSAYNRVAYPAGSSYWGVNGQYIANIVDIDFGGAVIDWGSLTHYVLCDSSSGGEIYAFGEFLNPSYVGAGDQVLVPGGGIVLALSSLQDSIAV